MHLLDCVDDGLVETIPGPASNIDPAHFAAGIDIHNGIDYRFDFRDCC